MPEPLQVTAAEAGQKLLQFLSRRFEEPQSVLHRWIRTGQVRINGGRAKPFDHFRRHLSAGEVRMCRGRNESGTRPRVVGRQGIAPHRCGDG